MSGQAAKLQKTWPVIVRISAIYNAHTEAAQKKKADAVTDLHRAIDHGYSDTEEIAQEEGWDPLRNDVVHQQAVARIKKQ